jgi:uncharacterized protein YndB with AHSA1/START domain
MQEPITIRRTFDAPRALVFKAWTDPDEVARWFGPAGFQVPRDSVEIEPRVGGVFRLVMVQPGTGREHVIDYEIVELAEPELLVLRAEPRPEMGLSEPTLARVELREEDGRTHMTLTDGPYAREAGQGASRGWEGAFDKMAAQLERLPQR